MSEGKAREGGGEGERGEGGCHYVMPKHYIIMSSAFEC